MGLFDADGQTDKESWLDPESGLLFHNAKYNWNNNAVEENSGLLETPSLSLFEEFIAEEDKSIFEDITVEATEPKGLMEIEPAEPAVVEETETAPEETDYETSRNAANVGLAIGNPLKVLLLSPKYSANSCKGFCLDDAIRL